MGLKWGTLIDADSGPLGYVLWCCGSRRWEVFTFFQIDSGHTVVELKLKMVPVNSNFIPHGNGYFMQKIEDILNTNLINLWLHCVRTKDMESLKTLIWHPPPIPLQQKKNRELVICSYNFPSFLWEISAPVEIGLLFGVFVVFSSVPF